MGGCIGVGVSVGGWGVPIHTHMHACTYMLNMIYMINMDASHGGGHLQFLYMGTCACVHVCTCTCMCSVWRHPHACRCPHPPAPSPESQGTQNTKIQ